ncbi:MAG TPA: MauE/DoxX family redox-associated membrane protein, partial [Candidatus Acidoferrales bacterium]|nr:MauE/DoxX family redox-associated membrane protein [Candidatus Acidoferrales bacterium]
MPTIDPAIAWTVSAALAAVFGASAIFKLIDLGEFRAAVENYRIVPERLAGAATIAIPLAEILGAVGLLDSRTRFASSIELALMLALFTAAIVVNLVRGRLYIDCGCFGPALRQPLSWWLPARNLALMGLATIAILPIGARTLTA